MTCDLGEIQNFDDGAQKHPDPVAGSGSQHGSIQSSIKSMPRAAVLRFRQFDLHWIASEIALGRSNYLFAGSVCGGRAAATMYSLLGTAKLNGINPYSWLKETLIKLPSQSSNHVAELLPLSHLKSA